MGWFSNRIDLARSDQTLNDEENEPFLGADHSESIKEEDSRPNSKLENSQAKTLLTVKFIMVLLTAAVLAVCINGVVGNSKQG